MSVLPDHIVDASSFMDVDAEVAAVQLPLSDTDISKTSMQWTPGSQVYLNIKKYFLVQK